MTLVLGGLSVSIGSRPVVRHVSATVANGQTLALLGRNGAGKSTLVRGLAGLLPLHGTATLDGTELTGLAPGPRSRVVGYVAQDLAATATRLSVLELLLLAQNSDRLSWRATADSMDRAAETLALLRLEPFAAALSAELSGGQRQMVHLALALVRRPRLLLLDEPTSALDLANQLHLLHVVRDYTARAGISTVMVLHDLSLAARFADRVLMLRDGAVAHEGTTDTVMTEATIGGIYGVSCRVLPVPGSPHKAIYPVHALSADTTP